VIAGNFKGPLGETDKLILLGTRSQLREFSELK
jgi:hypothetical protein